MVWEGHSITVMGIGREEKEKEGVCVVHLVAVSHCGDYYYPILPFHTQWVRMEREREIAPEQWTGLNIRGCVLVGPSDRGES